MVGIKWTGNIKSQEWKVAKDKLIDSNGRPLPNGTKLSRKTSGLSHSFMVIDNKILALNEKGTRLGSGLFGHAKLAEDEQGRLFALKISTIDNLSNEANISSDLHIAGKAVTRKNANKDTKYKHYVAYKYLGTRFKDYFIKNKATLSLDKRYELCTKIALALHTLQTGTQSKTNTPYVHRDIHHENIVIDDNDNIHLIDFGASHKIIKATDINFDIKFMLDSFYISACQKPFFGLLGNDKPREYQICFVKSKPMEQYIQEYELFLNQDPSFLKDSKYTKIAYTLRDSNGTLKEGTIDLSQLEIQPFAWEFQSLPPDEGIETQLIQKKDKILEIIATHGDLINQPKHLNILYNHLNQPQSTALGIAETFTLYRFNLELFQDILKDHTPDERLLAIKVLNSQSESIFELYNQINSLPQDLTNEVKDLAKEFLVHQALSRKTKSDSSCLSRLLLALDQSKDASNIKKSVENLISRMEQEKKLIAHAKSFTALVDSILSLKNYIEINIQDKLDALNSDLYDAGKTFFDQKYMSSQQLNTALSLFKNRCNSLITQAENDFSDNPGIWPKLKLVLNKILGVSLALCTLGGAIYLFGGLEAYETYFFSPPISQAWNDANIKNSLFAPKQQEKPGLFSQMEQDCNEPCMLQSIEICR